MKRLYKPLLILTPSCAVVSRIFAVGTLEGMAQGRIDPPGGWGLFLGLGAGFAASLLLALEINKRINRAN
jgi:hypothetical protein